MPRDFRGRQELPSDDNEYRIGEDGRSPGADKSCSVTRHYASSSDMHMKARRTTVGELVRVTSWKTQWMAYI